MLIKGALEKKQQTMDVLLDIEETFNNVITSAIKQVLSDLDVE